MPTSGYKKFLIGGAKVATTMFNNRYRTNSGYNATKIASDLNTIKRRLIGGKQKRAATLKKARMVPAPLVKVKKMGASLSKSRGFLKTRKGTNNPFNKYLKNGIVQATEHGEVLNSWNPADPSTQPSAQVLYVGHTTACPEAYRVIIGQAILKKLLRNCGLRSDDFTQLLPCQTLGTQALQIRLYSRTAAADANSPDGQDLVTWNVLTETPNTRAALLSDFLFPASDTTDQRIFTNLALFGAIGTTFVPLGFVDMQNLQIHFHVKSALKMQNRTGQLESNNEADDVDNVPIYGRSYGGTGNGAVYRGAYPASGTVGKIPLTANDFSWHIAPTPQTTLGTRANLWLEPPFQKEFIGCKESGKIHLDPGEIKTSLLNHTQSISFVRMYNMLYNGTTTPSAGYRFLFGKYRFFCVEKMIQALATTSFSSIKVAFEVDCKMGCYVTEKRSFATRMQVVLNPN